MPQLHPTPLPHLAVINAHLNGLVIPTIFGFVELLVRLVLGFVESHLDNLL